VVGNLVKIEKFIASKGELLGDTTSTRFLVPQNVIAKSITQVLSFKVGGGLLHTFQCTGPEDKGAAV
jgi:hypothetical protein